MSSAAPAAGAASGSPESTPAVAQAAIGSSFFWAMRLLPPARRHGMFAVYAFCRTVDDIADGDEPHGRRLDGLSWWRGEIDRLYAGAPEHRVSLALQPAVAGFKLRQADFLDVIEGMEMDAAQDIRAPTMDVLDRYCDRVASAVGRLSVRIFGLDDAQGLPLAHHLGRALQLTNILRDLHEDAQRNRLYLPAELLDRHGIASEEPSQVVRSAALPAVCRDLAERAIGHFAAADEVLATCPRRPARPALIMQAVYRRLLHRLIAAGWRDPTRRVSLPAPVKLWVALRHAYF